MTKKNILLLVLGLLSMVKIRVMGTFAAAEIIVFLSYLFIPIKGFLSNPKMKRLMLLAFVWLLGIIISDVYNQTPTTDALKGSFNVVFLISLIPFVYWAVADDPKRILYFWLGSGLSGLFSFYFLKSYDDFYAYDVWRVYAYYPLIMAVSGWLYSKERKAWAYLLAEGFAIWTLFHASRNVFLCLTMANILLIFTDRLQATEEESVMSKYRRSIVGLLVCFLIGAAVIDVSYEYGAANGYLGERAQAKYFMQKANVNGLASGREDFFMSSVLVSRNPIWGYGSYAKDKEGFTDKYLYEHGMEDNSGTKEIELLPGHSYIMGAWVYSGFLGAIFWFFVLWQWFRCMKRGTFLYEDRLTGLFTYFMFYYLWCILFSPFSDRLNFLMFIVPLIILNTEYVEDEELLETDEELLDYEIETPEYETETPENAYD